MIFKETENPERWCFFVMQMRKLATIDFQIQSILNKHGVNKYIFFIMICSWVILGFGRWYIGKYYPDDYKDM